MDFGHNILGRAEWPGILSTACYKRAPDRRRRYELRARFERIFRRRTGFVTLDRLLARLHANKEELLVGLPPAGWRVR
jgi:hypothetical protein